MKSLRECAGNSLAARALHFRAHGFRWCFERCVSRKCGKQHVTRAADK